MAAMGARAGDRTEVEEVCSEGSYPACSSALLTWRTGRNRQFLFLHLYLLTLKGLFMGWNWARNKSLGLCRLCTALTGFRFFCSFTKLRTTLNPAFSRFCIEVEPQCLVLSSLHLGANYHTPHKKMEIKTAAKMNLPIQLIKDLLAAF